MIIQKQDKRSLAREIAISYIGTLYRWGGDDPSGFDCSGFVNEILQSVGKLPRKGDWSASTLSTMFPKVGNPSLGCLVFWDNGTSIIHVEFCLDDELSIGASGGGSATLTQTDAISQNAYIKIRPFRTRDKLNCFVDPFAS